MTADGRDLLIQGGWTKSRGSSLMFFHLPLPRFAQDASCSGYPFRRRPRAAARRQNGRPSRPGCRRSAEPAAGPVSVPPGSRAGSSRCESPDGETARHRRQHPRDAGARPEQVQVAVVQPRPGHRLQARSRRTGASPPIQGSQAGTAQFVLNAVEHQTCGGGPAQPAVSPKRRPDIDPETRSSPGSGTPPAAGSPGPPGRPRRSGPSGGRCRPPGRSRRDRPLPDAGRGGRQVARLAEGVAQGVAAPEGQEGQRGRNRVERIDHIRKRARPPPATTSHVARTGPPPGRSPPAPRRSGSPARIFPPPARRPPRAGMRRFSATGSRPAAGLARMT